MDHCINTTKKILSLNNIRFTKNNLKESILSHPEYPSILTISDTLSQYSVENIAIKIDYEKLEDLPLPCIVQILEKGQEFFYILKSVENDSAKLVNEKGKLVSYSKSEFQEIWTGVCLLINRLNDSQEINYKDNLKAKRVFDFLNILLILVVGTWLTDSYFNSDSVNFKNVLLALIKVLGLIVSSLLLWWEIDKFNPTLQNLCSGGKKINCSSVLSSKYAYLLDGKISVSLIAFSYFFSTLFSAFVLNFSDPILSALSLLTIIGIPIAITSLIFQSVVLKQWCNFCIAIIGIIALEGLFFFLATPSFSTISLQVISTLILLFLLPVLGWNFLKPLLINKKEYYMFKRELKRVKYHSEVFQGLLKNSREITHSTKGLGLTFTNKNCNIDIIKVCNPYCGPCAKAHPILEKLFEEGKINLQILFTANDSPEDPGALPVKHFMAIKENSNANYIQHALNHWYVSEKNYQEYRQIFPIEDELLSQQSYKLKAMSEWCDNEEIKHTPTIFINGYELPPEYSVDDLPELLG